MEPLKYDTGSFMETVGKFGFYDNRQSPEQLCNYQLLLLITITNIEQVYVDYKMSRAARG